MMSLIYLRKHFFLMCIALTVVFAGTGIVDAQTVNRAAVLDFDGDGKTDFVVVRFALQPGGFVDYNWYPAQ